MSQSLEEQVNTIERALGECMIEHALVIIRAWLNELGENNPYEEAFSSIQTSYQDFFSRWLTAEDPNAAEQINTLTGDTYQLFDAVYAAIRLQRGLSPDMHGYNAESPQSVMNYFSNSVRLRTEDLDWLHEVLYDEDRMSIALMAVNSLMRSLRGCFNIDAFLALIDGIGSEVEMVSDQCLANAFTLVIQYDVRIPFFPQIQSALTNAIVEQGDNSEHAFEVMCAIIRTVMPTGVDAKIEEALNKLPEMLRDLFQKMGMDEEAGSITAFVPKTEQEYMAGLVQMFPQTWLYEVMIEGNVEREAEIMALYLKMGNRDLMWEHPEMAEEYYLQVLRSGSNNVNDYLNYAHCLMLKGDRMMAYEYYRQARQLSASTKDFYALYRPDRKLLADCGVPLEYIYLIEDNLLTSNL